MDLLDISIMEQLIKGYFLLEQNSSVLLQANYDLILVILSFCVATFASYTTLHLVSQMRDAYAAGKTSTARYWWLGGSLSLGGGIFAMHFIGMLAFSIPVTFRYDIGMTLFSLLSAVVASAIGLRQIRYPTVQLINIISAALLMATGIVTMHYSGMAALLAPALLRYEPGLWVLSVVIAISASLAALLLLRYILTVKNRLIVPLQIGTALLMGAATSGMHYTGMAAANFYSGGFCGVNTGLFDMQIENSQMGFFLTLFMILILGIGLIASKAHSLQGVNQLLEERVAERTNALRLQQVELERLNLAMDLHSIISVTDATGAITSVNDRFCEISGYGRDELLGQNHRILKSGQQSTAFYNEILETITAGVVWEGELCNLKKDGITHYWLRTTIVPFMDEQGAPLKYISIQTDHTGIKQASIELVNAKESAEAATEAKSDFLASMSHELRTPLAAIIGNSELLMELEQTPEQLELVQAVEGASRSQLALVNDILDMSKIESGKFSIDESPYDLNLFLYEVRQIFAVRAQDAGLEFEINSSIDSDYQLIGDRQRIGQVLINLLGNAIKFTEKGQITLNAFRSNDQLHFVVKDSGIGMSPEVLSRLFQRFEQADSSITSRFGGSGLGLYISQNLVSLMRGDIQVESEVNQGSEFHLTLPYVESELENHSDHSSVSEVGKKLLFSGHVLIAEDTPVLQKMERRMLESMGITVSVANNGIEAVNAATEQSFDLILMDMQMPLMDGIEATHTLKEQGVTTPIVALTANVMQKHRKAFHEAGCSSFLSKPLERPALHLILKQYLTLTTTQPRTSSDRRKGGDRRKESDHQVEKEAPLTDLQEIDSALSSAAMDESMLEMFNEFATEHYESLSIALAERDWEQIGSISHTIKGVGGTFGFPELSELGATICDGLEENKQPITVAEMLLSRLKAISSNPP